MFWLLFTLPHYEVGTQQWSGLCLTRGGGRPTHTGPPPLVKSFDFLNFILKVCIGHLWRRQTSLKNTWKFLFRRFAPGVKFRKKAIFGHATHARVRVNHVWTAVAHDETQYPNVPLCLWCSAGSMTACSMFEQTSTSRRPCPTRTPISPKIPSYPKCTQHFRILISKSQHEN